ncbi:hypothetical protein [Beduinella massiliensis]|uniref:hypothetical protein n=1 Tax=Beduinella massiliensis TaxID=1852363 RepID=UPI000C8308DB
MSASASASQSSAFAPVRAAFAAFRAHPRALLPALGAYLLTQAVCLPCGFLLDRVPESIPLLHLVAEFALRALIALADTAAALYVLRVFVRGERPGLSTLAEPLRWPSAYPKLLLVKFASPLFFFAVTVPIALFFDVGRSSSFAFLSFLSLPLFMLYQIWTESATVLLAVTRGKCRLRDFLVRPARSLGSLFVLAVIFELPTLLLPLVFALPPTALFQSYEQIDALLPSILQAVSASPSRRLALLILGLLPHLLALPRYAALGFLYERAVPAAASE